MIVFDLKCSREHVFEAWFDSSSAFETQKAQGFVECPICGCPEITKAVMAPAVPAKGNQQPSDADRKEQLRRLAAYQAEVESRCDYVGTSFVSEARARAGRPESKAGEATRGIIGEASISDAMALVSEGIEIAPLPFRIRQKADA